MSHGSAVSAIDKSKEAARKAAEEQYQHKVMAVRDLKAEKVEMRRVRVPIARCSCVDVYDCAILAVVR